MINLFSGEAHFQYAKSTRFHLQLMDEPSSDFSWMYNFFQQGNYAIRRSDRFGQGFGELAI